MSFLNKTASTILLVVGVLLGGSLLWRGYVGGGYAVLISADGNVRNLSAAEARGWLREHPTAQLLDVRSAGEHADGAIAGSLNIPIGDAEFEAKVRSQFDLTRPVFVYCASGMRSRRALPRLQAIGFAEIGHLEGGLRSW
jgi:rhodanese-related sulfurtransferase